MPRATLPRLHNSLLALLVAGSGLVIALFGAATAGDGLFTSPTLVAAASTAATADALRAAPQVEAVPLPGLDTPHVGRPLARRSRHALALPFFSFVPRG